MTVSRRQFLFVVGASTAAGLAGACTGDDDGAAPTSTTTASTAPPTTLQVVDHGQPTGADPFTLGVASGDPDHTSVVLWTRVDRDVGVQVEVALDEAFTGIIQRAQVIVDAEADNTVRVVATELSNDTAYWYRFIADGHVTAPARTRTAPAPGFAPAEPLRLAQVSCQRWSAGYWDAFADVAAQAPDLVVHCGDAVYERDRDDVRPQDLPPGTDLDSWRAIWRAYRSDPSFQAALAVAPWVFTWDDHEVENNYQGDTPGGRDGVTGDPAFLRRRAAAYRAWWEYTPTRIAPPDGPSVTVNRTLTWGSLATIIALDSRQYRDEQPCGDDVGTDLGSQCDEGETTTMLGDAQERWLDDQVAGGASTWTALVNQVMVMEWQLAPGNTAWNLDGWDGYPGARRRLLDTLRRAANPIVLTGDVHSSWVGDLEDDGDEVGVEFVTPGISSKVPSNLEGVGGLIEFQNSHIQWSETERRGWVLHTVAPDAWQAEYRLVDDADVAGSAIRTGSTWSVAAGERSAERTDG